MPDMRDATELRPHDLCFYKGETIVEVMNFETLDNKHLVRFIPGQSWSAEWVNRRHLLKVTKVRYGAWLERTQADKQEAQTHCVVCKHEFGSDPVVSCDVCHKSACSGCSVWDRNHPNIDFRCLNCK